MHNDNKADQAAKPSAGASDPKGKHAQQEEHPRKGRPRPSSTVDELDDAKETKPHEKARTQQYGKNYHRNTN